MPNPRLQQIVLAHRQQMHDDAEQEIRELQRLLGLSRDDILRLLDDLEGGEARYGEAGRARLLRDAVIALGATGMLWASFTRETSGIYQVAIERGWQLGLDTVDTVSSYMGHIPPRTASMVDMLKSNIIPFADKQTLAIESRIRGELVRGVLNGDSVRSISNRLIGAGLDTEGTPWKSAYARAETTVRAETSRAYHAAMTQNFGQADWVYGFQLMTFPEGPWPCADCAPYHGMVFEKGMQPMLPRHPRCRCTYLVVTKRYGAYDLS
jgi:hypothetical protein